MNLRKKNREFIQAVDYAQNARDLSDAAKAAGITADVVVDVAVGTRSGVPAGDQALELAQLVDKLPNLKFRGMLAYDGGAQHIKGYKARHDQSLARYEDAVRTFDRMKASGLNMEIFSGGGTGTYNIMTEVPGFTDVQVGSYVFMDTQYLEIGNEKGDIFTDFAPSLTVMTTVVNTYFPKRITTDAGTQGVDAEQARSDCHWRARVPLYRRVGRVRLDSVRQRQQDIQGRRQAGAHHPALRSGRERVRRVLRSAKRSSRGSMAGYRARQIAVGLAAAARIAALRAGRAAGSDVPI